MQLLNKLEKRFGKYAIENLPLWIVVAQLFVYALHFTSFPIESFYLVGSEVYKGQIWRLFTFMLIAPDYGMIGLLFFWYLLFLLGGALEKNWGAFRFNLFILIGGALTGIVALIFPQSYIPAVYVFQTVNFAFAILYPNFEFLIYFVLPVKAKWLGILNAAIWAFILIYEPVPEKFAVLASCVTLWLFFGNDLKLMLKNKKRKQVYEAEVSARAEEAFHTCKACGATDKSHPNRRFYYAAGDGYCEECQDQIPD